MYIYMCLPRPRLKNPYSTFQKLINNSWAKHKENYSREGVFICDKTHVDFHKTFASIFSAYTTSIFKILS